MCIRDRYNGFYYKRVEFVRALLLLDVVRVPRRVLFEASSNVLIGAGAFPVFGDHALRRFHLGGNV